MLYIVYNYDLAEGQSASGMHIWMAAIFRSRRGSWELFVSVGQRYNGHRINCLWMIDNVCHAQMGGQHGER